MCESGEYTIELIDEPNYYIRKLGNFYTFTRECCIQIILLIRLSTRTREHSKTKKFKSINFNQVN